MDNQPRKLSGPFDGWAAATDASPARWLTEAVTPFQAGDALVKNVLPTGFAARARLLHPAYASGGGGWRRVQLRQIDAPETRQWLVRDARFIMMTGWTVGQSDTYDYSSPDSGTPDPDDLEALVDLLAEQTTTPQHIWALTWPGWGVRPECDWIDAECPKVGIGYDQFGLLHGPLDALSRMARALTYAPSYWWPQDRAWVVATLIEDFSTYVAGTTTCIDALLTSARVDVRRAYPDDLVWPPGYYPGTG